MLQEDDRFELLQNLYVANVKNRLRELESPSEELQKRWIWELIQNAKDCSRELACFKLIPDQILRNKSDHQVSIKIFYDKSQQKVVFMHDGFPFIKKTLDSLMYKNSTKDSEEDNTGKFGTGFMTSHTLSRVVKIQAPYYKQTQSSFELQYMMATVFREGKTDKQLRQEFLKMEKSKKFYTFNKNQPIEKWTIFTYNLKDSAGIRSAELGIQSFRENIIKVLLFCNEIKSIQINDEKPFLSSQIQSTRIDSSTLFNFEEKTINQQKFFVTTVNETNSQYLQKISIEREKNFDDKKLQCSIAFEIDSNKQIVDNKQNGICLFCTFPLVGSEDVQLPFLLNSPQFETLTERDGIVLEGNKYDSDNILTNTGLNCIILDHSIHLFSIVLAYLSKVQYHHFSTFSNGLTNSVVKNPKMIQFYNKLRSTMENKCTIRINGNQTMLLKNVLFLDFHNIINQKAFHFLVSQFYSNVASFDECIQWNGKLWNGLSVVDINTFLNHIECIGNDKQFRTQKCLNYQLSPKLFINGLKCLTDNDITFLNDLYYFLINGVRTTKNYWGGSNSKIYEYQIILNSNNNFDYLNSLTNDADFSPDLKRIMNLCTSWKNKTIHPKIKALIYQFQNNNNKNDAIFELSNFVNRHQSDIQLLLSLTQFVLKGNDFRNKMYKVAKYFYGFQLGPIINVSDVDLKIWNDSDKFLLNHIKNLIQSEKNKKIEEIDIDYYNIFYELYQIKNPYDNSNNLLIPNIYFDFVEKSKLAMLSEEVPQALFDIFKQFVNFSSAVHPKITSIKLNKVYTMNGFVKIASSSDFLLYNGHLRLDRISTILNILPSKENQRLYNYQTSILFLAQLFLNIEINTTEIEIADELFWKLANEKVLNYVDDTIKKNKNLENLKNQLQKDEDIIINHLNVYYKLLSANSFDQNLKNVMVPTMKGVFHYASEVSLSKGISNELFDLFNLIRSDFDIREKLAHPKIECIFLKVIDINEFLSLLCKNLKDDQLIHDSKIIDAISNLKLFNSNNSSSENDPLLEKLYVANIKNRLNEIRNPNENDKARWPWELIQNAKDTIYSPSNTIGQKKVKIFINIKCDPSNNNLYNEVIFSHNGLPFTENSYFGLLYKISQEKNSNKTTGKFGTGFVSTHVLSKVVEVTGNKIEKNGEKQGFSVTIHREGLNDPDIIDDFRKMQKSLQTKSQTNFSTSFKYEIKTEQSRECVKLGLDNLKRNISAVLINCDEIKFINLNENGFNSHFYSTNQFIKKIENYSFYIYRIFKNRKQFKKYIVLIDELNHLNVSLQVTERWEIIHHFGSESLFSIFPLVGSSAHVLPFLINSPGFEIVTERNALYLNGQSEITLKNRSLLIESINLYKNLIQILIENKCPNLYELSRGLLLSQKPYETFDLDWYENNFLFKMRQILARKIYVHSNYGRLVLLENASFSSNEINISDLQQFIVLAQKYFVNIVCKKDTLVWKDKIWNTLNIVTIKDLINKVINDQSFFTKDHLLYLNNLIGFIWKYDKNLLYDYSIIPDMNNKFHCYDDFKESKTVPDTLIQIMETIQISWKSTHMNNIISSIKLPEDKVIDAENKIIEKIRKNDSLSFELMRFVLENNELRQNMFDFVCELKFKTFQKIIVKNINIKIWESADQYVLHKIVEKIETFNRNDVEKSIGFLYKFLTFMKKFYNENALFIESKIYPNAICQLKKINELKNKSEYFHDHLNPIMKKYFNRNFDNEILHPHINQVIKSKKNECISDYLKIINRNIFGLHPNDQILIAESIVSLVPPNEKSYDQFIKSEILSIYKKLLNSKLKEIQIPSNLYSKDLWHNCNQIIITRICAKIEETKTLNNLEKIFNSDKKCFDVLNSIYLLSNEYKIEYKIIPNRNGIFMNKDDLFEDPKIGDDLFEFMSNLKPEFDCREKIADNRVQNISLEKFNISEFYKNFYRIFIKAIKNPNENGKVFELIKNITNFDDPSFFDKMVSNSITNDQKVRNDILQDAHVSFIKNRLRELDSPRPKDFQRWPFELIQNANDSILSSKNELNNQKVRIEFQFLDDKVIFRHNGSPFKYKSLMALLYQYSKGKSNNNLTTGRFGTGFMSTFILSRNVHISGDVESEHVSGFDVMIYRDGKNKKELKNGVKKMEKSLRINQPIKGMTTFEYDFKNSSQFYENSVEAYKKGFDSLTSNIAQVLILNPTIETVVINYKNELTVYKANHENGPIQTVTINQNNKIKTIIYLLFNTTEKFQSNDVSIDCLLQIGFGNSIVNSNNKNFLFISYPLIDNKGFNSPIIINSMQFEPEKERDNIIIQINIKNESYESSVNKFIISKSVDVFKKMVDFISKSNFTDLFNLCVGLKCNSDNLFYQKSFINEMRKVILNSQVFETQSGLKNYTEIIIPFIENINDLLENIDSVDNNKREKEIYKEFYDLVSQLSIESKFVMPLETCKKWISLLWSDFESKFSIFDLLKFISKKRNINEISLINNNCNDSKVLFMRNLITFIKKLKNSDYILNKYELLVNIKGNFVCKKEICFFKLPAVFFNLLDIVDFDYREQTLHNELQYLYQDCNFKKFELNDAIEKVKDEINADNSIQIIQYIFNKDEKREELFQYSKLILDNSIQKIQIDISGFEYNEDKLKEMFHKIDDFIIDQIINKIRILDVKKSIQFLKNFVNFLRTKISLEEFQKKQIFPNQEYNLCLPGNLFKDGFKDENVKNVINQILSINLRETLVLDLFSDMIKFETKNFSNFSKEILNCLSNGLFVEEKSFDERMDLYSIIFQFSDFEDDQIKILDLLHFFFGIEIKQKESKQEDCWSRALTKEVIKMAVNELIQFISKFSDIQEIVSKIQINDNSEMNILFENLSILYTFSTDGKIFPNLYGQLQSKDSIYIIHDNNIDRELLNQLFELFIQFRNSDEIKNDILDQSIQIQEEKLKEFKIIDLNFLSSEIMELIKLNKIEGKENKSLIQKLYEIIDSEPKMRVFFTELIEEKFNEIPLSILNEFYQEMEDESKDIGYRGEALVYEELSKSGKFSNVIWLANSSMPTSIVITLDNGNKYYIAEANEPYDIKAKDFEGNNFYFEVKSKKSFTENRQIKLGLSRNQIGFADSVDEEKDNFVFVFVLDVKEKNPFFIFLKKATQQFIDIEK